MRTSILSAVVLTTVALTPLTSLAKSRHQDDRGPSIQASMTAKVAAEQREVKQRINRWLHQTLRGSLTSIEGSVLNLKVSDVNFRVDTTSSTFIGRDSNSITLNDLRAGDSLIVHGTWTDGGVVKASKIQDLSVDFKQGTFVGNIASIGTSTFMMTTNKRGTQTIAWDSTTSFTKNGEAASSSVLAVGNAVRVKASWNRDNGTALAKTVAVTTPLVQVHVTGRVTAISGEALTVLGNDGKTYTVNTHAAATVYSTYLRMKAKTIQVGDSLDIWARAESGSLKLKAYFIRDLSQMNGKTQIITMTDLNGTRSVDVGDRVVLRLNSGYVWSTATSSNVTVLAPVSGVPRTFDAKAAGTADLTLTGEPTCRTATPACALPSLLFTVRVQVVNAAS